MRECAFPSTNSKYGEVAQMSIFLALIQTLLAAAPLGVALLALERVDPPPSDGSQQQIEDEAPPLPGRPCDVPALRD